MQDAGSDSGTKVGAGGGGTGFRALQGAAFVVVLIAGLKLGGSLLIPVIVAAFVTIVCAPAVRVLQRLHIPSGLGVVLVLAGVLGIILLVSVPIANSASGFAEKKDEYRAVFEQKFGELKDWLQGHGIEIGEPEDKKPWAPKQVFAYAGQAATAVADVFSSVFLVLLIVVFMLMEASGLPRKIQMALGDPDADLSRFGEIGRQVWGYLGVKTAISLLTGILVWVFLTIVGVDYAALWGLLSFLLNYIPNIGSLLAAIPPVALALLTPEGEGGGVGTALAVVIGMVAINQVLGNVVEPRLMGAKLGLSPLVVFLSLVFWGWLWGPTGMLLSVPLTMVVKIVLENFEDLRWLAVLMGPADPPPKKEPSAPV